MPHPVHAWRFFPLVLCVQYGMIGARTTPNKRTCQPELAYPYERYSTCSENMRTLVKPYLENTRSRPNFISVNRISLIGERQPVTVDFNVGGHSHHLYV